MKIAILAGGLGTRLPKEYSGIAKSMIPFGGVPFILHQLHLLYKNGLTDVVLCTGHNSKLLEEYISLISKGLKMNIKISNDGKKLLKTGGAIKKALPLLGDSFMVIYGDSYLDFDYNRMIERFNLMQPLAMISVYRNKNKYDKSNIEFGEKGIIYNKLNPSPICEYIDYGATIFRKEAFENTQPRFDLSWLLEMLSQEKKLDYHLIPEINRFYQVGTLEGINEFRKMITK